MEYRDTVKILMIENVRDELGGLIEELVVVDEIKCKIAPYSVKTVPDILVPHPYSSIKFFTRSDVLNEDDEFYLMVNNKVYKKINFSDYGKCKLIVGERAIEFENRN